MQSNVNPYRLSLDWADELAAAADRLADDVQALDNQFAAHLSDAGMAEIQETLPEVRRKLNSIVAVLACRKARLGFPERAIELAIQASD